MAQTDANAAAAAWQAGMNNAATKIKSGVMAVTVAPGVKAAAQQQKLLTNFQNAVNSGKWARNVQATTLQSWQASMTGKGLQNMANGVNAAQGKVLNVMQQLLPQTAAISAKIQQMPSATPQDMQNRMIANMQAMMNVKITPSSS